MRGRRRKLRPRQGRGVLGAGPRRRAGQEGWAALGDADGGEDGVGEGRCFVAAPGRSGASGAGAAPVRAAGPERLARGPAAARETRCRGPGVAAATSLPNRRWPAPAYPGQCGARRGPPARLPGAGERRRQRLRARCLPPALHCPDAPARRRDSAPPRPRPRPRQSALPRLRPGPGRLTAAPAAAAAAAGRGNPGLQCRGAGRRGAGSGSTAQPFPAPSRPLSQAPVGRRPEAGALRRPHLPSQAAFPQQPCQEVLSEAPTSC